MATVTFDTPKYVRQLEAAGIAPQQAEAFVTAQRDILSDALDTQLATKADIFRLESKLDAGLLRIENKTDALESRLTIKLGAVVVVAVGAVAAIVKLM